MATITPLPADTTIITGGTAITSIPGNVGGGFIQNPVDPLDQGILSGVPQPIYIDPINVPGSSPGSGNGTTFVLYPGQTWEVPTGQSTPTRVNGPVSGQRFSGIYWPNI